MDRLTLENPMCPDPSILIRLVSGELPPEQAASVEEHLRSCPACAQLRAELAQTWAMIGEYSVDPPHRDLAPSILARAHRGSRLRMVAALAASLLLATTLGIVGALSLPPRTPPTAARTITDEEVAHSIGLDDLFEDSHLAHLIDSPEDHS